MKKILLLLFVVISTMGIAQKFKIQSGDLKFLKGVETVNVTFDYTDMKLMKENFSEEEYISRRVEEVNKKTGGGDIWKKQWQRSKEEVWNPKFITIFNKVLSKEGVNTVLQEKGKSLYTLKVKVKWIFAGWDAGIMRQPAKVTTQLTFIETKTKKIMCEIESVDAPGNQWGSNFNNETRIGEGFAKTAKTLALNIEKEVK